MDGLFLVGLGLLAIFVGITNALPLHRLNPRIRKPVTGISRGRELGGYALMIFGGILVGIGLIAVALHLVGITN